jgi:hypothetical protein
MALKDLKKAVYYDGIKYLITFTTTETSDMDITYIKVNGTMINDIRIYDDQICFDVLKLAITEAIEKYLIIVQPIKEAARLVDNFNSWDGNLKKL